MKRPILTKEIAYAAGFDAANKSMRKAGRTAWDEQDYGIACDVTNSLLDKIKASQEASELS